MRYQPVFLIDKGFYRVRVYDPFENKDVLVDFGDSNSPSITLSLLESDANTLKLRDQYLAKTHSTFDPLTPEYWTRRYVWLSKDPYTYYVAPDDTKTVEPSFPAQNAIDPPHRTVIVPGYAYGAPYYTPVGYPYGTYVTTYHPYYSARRYGPGSLALAGLGAFALGALLL
jgi:hypothetical protein